MNRIWTKLPWFFALAIVAALLAYGFSPKAIEVDTAVVERGSFEITVEDEGETRIRERYTVSAPVTGRLIRIQHEAGDYVVKGETELALIEPSIPQLLDARTQAESKARVRAAQAAVGQADANLVRAEEALKLAEHEFDRAKQLIKRKALSQADYDSAEHGQRIATADRNTAQSALSVARFEYEQAQVAAAQYTADGDSEQEARVRLVSPIDGKVLRVHLEDAGPVSATTPLLDVGDPKDLEFTIDVLSSDAVRIRSGDKVYVRHWGGEGVLEGQVRTIEPSAFLKVSSLGVEEKRVTVVADFTQPWSCRETLGDGFRIEAQIVVESTSEDSLYIPSGALFREGEDWFVFLVSNGTAEQRKVSIGKSNGLKTEITGGLNQGDTVILYPTNDIDSGVRVASSGQA
jgi:HlyD family secretion protein